MGARVRANDIFKFIDVTNDKITQHTPTRQEFVCCRIMKFQKTMAYVELIAINVKTMLSNKVAQFMVIKTWYLLRIITMCILINLFFYFLIDKDKNIFDI